MQHETPDDWVLATGTTHTVKEFLEIAFGILDLNWEKYVQTSERYFRPNEVEYLLGDASKAEKELNWKPKTSFKELVDMMVKNDIENAKQDQILLKENLIKPTWEYPIS